MATYQIEFAVEASRTIEVEAATREEAIQMALDGEGVEIDYQLGGLEEDSIDTIYKMGKDGVGKRIRT